MFFPPSYELGHKKGSHFWLPGIVNLGIIEGRRTIGIAFETYLSRMHFESWYLWMLLFNVAKEMMIRIAQLISGHGHFLAAKVRGGERVYVVPRGSRCRRS